MWNKLLPSIPATLSRCLAFNGAIVLPSIKVFWTLDKVF